MQFDHYTIRPLLYSDVDAYFSMVDKNRKRLEDYFTGTVSKTKTKEDTARFLREIEERRNLRDYFPYIIVDDSNGVIAGFLDLKNIDWSVPKAETGSYIAHEYEGRGITTKAFTVFCEHCFQEFGLAKIFLRTHASNAAARKVAEKCGFKLEGELRRDYKTTSGELIDLLYYGRLR